MSYNRPCATNPVSEAHVPSSEMARVGHSYSPSPEHPGERVTDSSQHHGGQTSLAMQYVNHANVPSAQVGYVYMAEPGILRGVTDVDVDEKPHVVYETMAEVHVAKQRMMDRDGAVKAANEKVVPDYSSTHNKSKRGYESVILLIKIIWNVLLFVLVVGAFALSVYTFLDKNVAVSNPTSSPVTTDTSIPSTVTDDNGDTAAQLQKLNDTIAELRAQIDLVSATHEDRYNALNESIVSAVQSVQTVVPTDQLDLYAGCMLDSAECIIPRGDVGTEIPGRASCETSPQELVLVGYTNTDMYCSIDNSARETNPITSSLNIFGGQVSCLCSLVALAMPNADPVCKLQIRRCPNTIRLNTTTMR